MEVRDFSDKIIEVARANNGKNPPDYAGPFLSAVVTSLSYIPTKSLLTSNNIAFHVTGSVCGIAAYLTHTLSERRNNSKLIKHAEDPRFKDYGLDEHYNVGELMSKQPSINLRKPNINFKQNSKDIANKTKKTLSSVKENLSYIVHHPIEVSKRIKNSVKKTAKETFFYVKDDLNHLIHNPRIIAEKVKETAKKVSYIYENEPIIKITREYTQVVLGILTPPLSYGYTLGVSVDHFSRSGKIKEIEKSITIGNEVEKKLEKYLSKEEIETFLEGLMKS